jgi:hypothetical protein
MGAKKQSTVDSTSSDKKGLYGSLMTSKSAIDSNVSSRMNEDLEKQFMDGVNRRMQAGRNSGLGFE